MSAPTAARPAGSYDPASTTAGGFIAECARLEAQAELSFAAELEVLQRLQPTLEGPLVEIGAGSGAVTRRLRSALPQLPVLALDIDPRLLTQATAADARMVCDAARLPLADQSAGTVLLRYVLQHLSDPAGVLAEVRRVLRPGGRVIVTDVDDQLWGTADPTFPELAAIHARLAARQSRDGGNRAIARQLTRMLRRAGFSDVGITPFAVTNDARPTADFAAHLGPGRLAPLLASGDISLSQFAIVTDRWKRFAADPEAWVMLLGYTAHGTNRSGLGHEQERNHQ